MALIKRNIWTLFILIVVGGALILGALLVYRWNSIEQNYIQYHLSRAKLASQTVDSVLRTQELVLDLVGEEVVSAGIDDIHSKPLELLDNLLEVNKMLVAFGLALPDGTLIRVSSNLDINKLPNLKTNPNTRDGFAKALQSDQMEIGRTYYLNAANAWVIPIRKAIRNNKGDVIAVMTAGLTLGDGTRFNNELTYEGPYDSFVLFQDKDRYVQFFSKAGITPEQYTAIQVTPEQRQLEGSLMQQNTNLSLHQIRESGEAIYWQVERPTGKFLSAGAFNTRYNLWVISDVEYTPINREFYWSAFILSTIYVAIIVTLFFLFRIIHNAELKRRMELLHISQHDQLTGLMNRVGIINVLDRKVTEKQGFFLGIINIENFRSVNDRYGVDTGDNALRAFAYRLRNVAKVAEYVARLSAGEFAVIVHAEKFDESGHFCDQLIQQLSSTYEIGPIQLALTVNIGASVFPEHGTTTTDLIRNAHLASYTAISSGKPVCVYQSEMELKYIRRLSVEQHLRKALENDKLHMVYQRQVNERHEVIAMEALVRWHDEELGFVSPEEFIDVAEKSGLIIKLGKFVIKSAIKEYKQLITTTNLDIELAINISVIQFQQPDFIDLVFKFLKKYEVPPEKLILEITENLFMDDFEHVLDTIKVLRNDGIKISMDDFGTGYSSLSLLRRLPIDELKIDKSFVDNILDDRKAASTIESIIAIADSHELDLIAEGVEEEAQAAKLNEMGCYRYQGYHFYRPQKIQEIIDDVS